MTELEIEGGDSTFAFQTFSCHLLEASSPRDRREAVEPSFREIGTTRTRFRIYFAYALAHAAMRLLLENPLSRFSSSRGLNDPLEDENTPEGVFQPAVPVKNESCRGHMMLQDPVEGI